MLIPILGVAGSGKSTQGKKLAEKGGFEWLSMGQLIRDKASPKMQSVMLEGLNVEDSDSIRILNEEFNSHGREINIVMDGFPRTANQTEWLIEQMCDGAINVGAVVHLNAHEKAIEERLVKRGRVDDVPEAIAKRFESYQQEIRPILDMLKGAGIVVIEIDAEQGPDKVFGDILEGLRRNNIDI